MNETPSYAPIKLPEAAPQSTAVERSVSRDDSFSKPGSMGKAGKWQPAKGTRFRATHEKARGRRRKRGRDERSITFY